MNPLLLYLCIANLLLYVYLATGRLVSSKGCDKIYTGVPSIVIIFRQVQKLLLYCSWSITPYGPDFSFYKTFQNVVYGRIEDVLLACPNKVLLL